MPVAEFVIRIPRVSVAVSEAELTELVWLPITEASRLDMSAITIAMLEELNARIEAGFSHDLPVPYYRVLNRRRMRELL